MRTSLQQVGAKLNLNACLGDRSTDFEPRLLGALAGDGNSTPRIFSTVSPDVGVFFAYNWFTIHVYIYCIYIMYIIHIYIYC